MVSGLQSELELLEDQILYFSGSPHGSEIFFFRLRGAGPSLHWRTFVVHLVLGGGAAGEGEEEQLLSYGYWLQHSFSSSSSVVTSNCAGEPGLQQQSPPPFYSVNLFLKNLPTDFATDFFDLLP